jgi:adenylate kinase family enzyme
MNATKLVVLRGPSGSGKTATAKILFERASARVSLIEQDHYRFIFKPASGGSKPNSAAIHKMIASDVLIALDEGYNVILEGILGPKSYDKVLDDIFKRHTGKNYIYYFDISFEEIVRRNTTRITDFGAEDMKDWYAASYPSVQHNEVIIQESSTLEETVSKIMSEAGL